MYLYLVRHGQTYGNAEKFVQGWTDVDLTELGRSQAARAGELLKDLKFEKIFCSDLQRTRTTASIVFGDEAELTFDERLRELNNTVIANRKLSELAKEYGDKITKAARTLDYSYFGGESALQLMARAADFLTELGRLSENEYYKDKNFAAVTHGGVIHAMMSYIVECRLDSRNIAISNGSVTVLKCSNGKWTVRYVNYVGSLSETEDKPLF